MKIRFCFVALCLLVFYCSAAYGQTAEWEYKQLRNPSDELLNHYAKNGWEIDDAAGGGGDSGWHMVIMKRGRSHPFFGKKTEEKPAPQPPPPPQKPTCKLTLAQAPVIRGLQLGMTSDEVFAIPQRYTIPPEGGTTNTFSSFQRIASRSPSSINFIIFSTEVASQ